MKDTAIRFTPDNLYANEREDLVHFAKEQFEMLFDVVRLAKASNALGAKVTTIGKTTRATVYSTSRISASLSEVKDIFFSEHTHFATGFAQSQRLYSLMSPSNNHPMRSAAVRWSLWDSPSKMNRKRDILYVEYTDSFMDENGRRGWARCTHSIEHRSCPPLDSSHNVVRAHMYCSGSLYTETDEPGVLEVVTLFDVDTRGVPAWMSKTIALKKAQSATSVEHLIRLSRAMSDEEDPDVKLIELQVKGKTCRACGDHVSKWSPGRKCRECKECLCKSCSEVVYYNSEERKKLKHICVYCVDDVITDADQRGELFSGLQPISENGNGTRRMHHMSFRSLRMARETNFSISPRAPSTRLTSGLTKKSFSTGQLLAHRSVFRTDSDPGSRSYNHLPMPKLRATKSITV
ncbi:hypothetical protein Poli38472_007488 [Pythium oligandrum]|uniref:START domain-containing protein n=1 Tax=Pythium oligandrum TaxID=41045 RepID=A0A8K1FM38_PYTOL|nr:hypothetical protein Poli38472_007488 [Pythium oligandrum]|eukprot:TMW67816.1 hypothetical protein Poli38472_007488 [Pythium oligandrum]